MRSLRVLPITAALAAALPAQTNGITAGFGRPTFELDLQAATSNIANLGVARLGDELWISRADQSGSSHTFGVYDASTRAYLREVAQPAFTSSSGWGLRDGASDGIRTLWGFDDGIHVLEPDGSAQFATLLQTASGPRTVLNPIPRPVGVSVARAVAYDPAGDGGRGSVWTGDFANDLFELDLSGNVLRTIPNSFGASIYGLAFDRERGTLWCSDEGSGRIAELDPVTGAWSGSRFATGLSASPGGIDWIDGTRSEGRPCGRDLAVLTQTTPDVVVGHRVDLIDGYGFENEPQLLVGVDGAATTPGVVAIDPLRTGLAFDLDRPGVPYALFFNFEPESTLQRPVGPLAGLFPEAWEFRRIFVPGITSVSTTSGTPFTAPSSWYATNWPFGQQIRVQAVYIDPAIAGCGPYLPLGVTNEAGWDWAGSLVAVRAVGDDSAIVATDPFWTVEVAPQFAGEVVRLKVDFSTSAVPAHASYRFRPSHATTLTFGTQSFRYGRGAGFPALCVGTYRGSDRDVALDYNWTGGNLRTTCFGTAIGPGSRIDANDQSMEWRFRSGGAGNFAGGESFVFDLRVQDGIRGVPIRGSDVAGAVVTIGLADGRTASAVLFQESPNSSLAWFPF